MAKGKWTNDNNDLQNTTQILKDQTTRIKLKTWSSRLVSKSDK